MLAWLSDMVIFRLNRVPDGLYSKFNRLLTGVTDGSTDSAGNVVEELFQPYRAITPADFETLALGAVPGQIARATCLVNRNLEYSTHQETGHVSIVVVPAGGQDRPSPGKDLLKQLHTYLLPRTLIATPVHVVGPEYVDMNVIFKVSEKPGVPPEALDTRIRERLRDFLHPVSGGPDGKGWPFGRDVLISEIYRLIEETRGVDYTAAAQIIPLTATGPGEGTDRLPIPSHGLPWYTGPG
jgi:predicted phage baseplate assembly protein